jgi:hypothetical protein
MRTRELGIKAGETWAYLRTPKYPLVPVRIINPGIYYDDRIIIEELLGARWRKSVHRVRLPCKWDRVDEYARDYSGALLEIQREATAEPMFSEPVQIPDEPLNHSEVLILARLAGVEFDRPIAYNIASAAAAVGYSLSTMKNVVRRGQLPVHYANTRGIILYDDLWNWVSSLPLISPAFLDPAPLPDPPTLSKRSKQKGR